MWHTVVCRAGSEFAIETQVFVLLHAFLIPDMDKPDVFHINLRSLLINSAPTPDFCYEILHSGVFVKDKKLLLKNIIQ